MLPKFSRHNHRSLDSDPLAMLRTSCSCIYYTPVCQPRTKCNLRKEMRRRRKGEFVNFAWNNRLETIFLSAENHQPHTMRCARFDDGLNEWVYIRMPPLVVASNGKDVQYIYHKYAEMALLSLNCGPKPMFLHVMKQRESTNIRFWRSWPHDVCDAMHDSHFPWHNGWTLWNGLWIRWIQSEVIGEKFFIFMVRSLHFWFLSKFIL